MNMYAKITLGVIILWVIIIIILDKIRTREKPNLKEEKEDVDYWDKDEEENDDRDCPYQETPINITQYLLPQCKKKETS